MPDLAAVAPNIVLCTLNARYIHASLGLRYLLANMGDLKAQTAMCEFTIARRPQEIAAELLALLDEPQDGATQVIGLGVYIWNATQSIELVRLLKAARPSVKIVLGGPEISHEVEQQEIAHLADFVITGWGDVSFPKLCRALLHGPLPAAKVVRGEQPALDEIALPYGEYSDADLAHRLLYVEASRGCPFKCDFCLSSLDQTAWAFDLERFLAAMRILHQRGARNFKFVDRTFNLKIDTSVRILQFFLERLTDDLFLHFELVPDHLPERLKALIMQFPPGVLQFEIGVQSFNPEVQSRISRRQDNAKTEANLRWLTQASHAHLHSDLIFGLPGETLESFAAGFDRLCALQPDEIQLGVLKRLRGTPIERHSAEHAMVYDADPPYTVLQTGVLDAGTVQRFKRFARYWDLIANSGRFKQSLPLLLEPEQPSPFHAFLAFSDWLWRRTEKTCELSPELLVDALADYLCGACGMNRQNVQQALLSDYTGSGARAKPHALQGLLPKQPAPAMRRPKRLAQRQGRHLDPDQALR
jgi:hypothetical protein